MRLRQDAAGTLGVQALRKQREGTGGRSADPPSGRRAAAVLVAVDRMRPVYALSCGLGDLVVHRLEHLVLPLLMV
jgi:hypothetical protein